MSDDARVNGGSSPGPSGPGDEPGAGPGAKAWAGRFSEPTDALVDAFTASLPFDRRLYKQDIACSTAHARMLAAVGLISADAAAAIESELSNIEKEIAAGSFPFAPGDEDIHMAIERALTERTGEAGASLHTARSRNDQVATDLRLWAKDEIDVLTAGVRNFQAVLVERAQEHAGAAATQEHAGAAGAAASAAPTIMPGYTHMQRAQPVLLSHHLLAYFWMFERDAGRLSDCRKRADVMPLGSGALAGTTLPIDRAKPAADLGFARVSENSLDAVSDRDFVVELLAALSLVMVHLSRLSEEVIMWTSSEFGFAELPDSYATGSSMMPQKKNPDVAELVRGKAGRVFGQLTAMLTTLKGLPLSYNRDLQEDKEGLFDGVDTVKLALAVFAGLMSGLRFDRERLLAASEDEALHVTDLMEYLVKKGVPLRSAHNIVGRIVRHGLDAGSPLKELSLDVFKQFSEAFDEDLYDVFSARASVQGKASEGGSGPESLARQLSLARSALADRDPDHI